MILFVEPVFTLLKSTKYQNLNRLIIRWLLEEQEETGPKGRRED